MSFEGVTPQFDFTEQVVRNVLASLLGFTESPSETVTKGFFDSAIQKLGKSKARKRVREQITKPKVQFVAYKPRQPGGTAICTSLDGRVWNIDDPNKRVPPIHWNCRSVLRPVTGLTP